MIGGVEGYDTPACGGTRPRARDRSRAVTSRARPRARARATERVNFVRMSPARRALARAWNTPRAVVAMTTTTTTTSAPGGWGARWASAPAMAAIARAGPRGGFERAFERSFGASARARECALKATVAAQIPKTNERLRAIKQAHGDQSVGEVTVNMVMGGMRGITGMMYETSLLDAEEGIRFRGYTIPELRERLRLQKAAGRTAAGGDHVVDAHG